MTPNAPTLVQRIDLGAASAYLVTGPRPVLIDTGTPGQGQRIVAEIRRRGHDPRRLSLIVLTHGHWDHAGSADEVRQLTGAPIGLHPTDRHHVRAGRATLPPRTIIGRLASGFFSSRTFTPFAVDIDLHDGLDLAPYGVAGQVLATPGHTPGSISVVLASGEAIIGDVLRGSFLGRNRPRTHFFAEAPDQIAASTQRLNGLGLTQLYTGHGLPFSGQALRRFAEAR